MNHYFHLSFTGTDADGDTLYRSAFLYSSEYKVTKGEIENISASIPEEGLHLMCISYMGQMTQDEFENGASA